MEISIAQVRAAQANDISAVREVISATEGRVTRLATKAAGRMTHGFSHYREEFAQIGRIAVWEALGRFTGDTEDAFMRFVYTTVEGKLLDAVRERSQAAGVDENVAKTYAAMIAAADGDPYEAERLAQVLPPKGRRLSAEMANAARLAWQGSVSLEKPLGESGTVADTLAEPAAEPDGEVRPKVGLGAAVQALSVLQRYAGVNVQRMTPGEFAANLPALVETLEDTVRVPRDPQVRRYVADAMAILRSAVSTTTDSALTEDLMGAADERMADAREKHNRVHDCLNSMGEAQYQVLTHSFGIGGASDYGWGDGCDMDGLCEALGMTYSNAKAHRAKGRRAFAKRYIAATSLVAPALAQALEAAAAANLTNGGRK